MPLAAAVVGVTAIGAISSSKAAKQQAAGTQKGLDASAELAKQARSDVTRLFQIGQQQGRNGMEAAFNFYKTAAPERIAPMQQGYTQAQNVLGQGAQQANNAILGLPVDMGFTNQEPIQAPQNYLGAAQLPAMQSMQGDVAPVSGPAQQAPQQFNNGKYATEMGAIKNAGINAVLGRF